MLLRDVTLGGALSGLSAFVKSINLNFNAAALVDTAMGDTTRSSAAGLFEWDGTITFFQDYADNSVDEVIHALIGTTGSFLAKPTSAAISAANPEYGGTALFTGYAPIQGDVGVLGETTLAFTSAGALARDITP